MVVIFNQCYCVGFAQALAANRPLLTCRCGRSIQRLFYRHGSLACRRCHKLVYASQAHNQFARPRLQASKLRLSIGSQPSIHEPIAPKLKWKHHKRYQALRNQIQALEAQAKQTRFCKEIDTRTLGYHVG